MFYRQAQGPVTSSVQQVMIRDGGEQAALGGLQSAYYGSCRALGLLLRWHAATQGR